MSGLCVRPIYLNMVFLSSEKGSWPVGQSSNTLFMVLRVFQDPLPRLEDIQVSEFCRGFHFVPFRIRFVKSLLLLLESKLWVSSLVGCGFKLECCMATQIANSFLKERSRLIAYFKNLWIG